MIHKQIPKDQKHSHPDEIKWTKIENKWLKTKSIYTVVYHDDEFKVLNKNEFAHDMTWPTLSTRKARRMQCSRDEIKWPHEWNKLLWNVMLRWRNISNQMYNSNFWNETEYELKG